MHLSSSSPIFLTALYITRRKIPHLPGVRHTDDVVRVREGNTKQFVGDDSTGIRKAKQRMVCEHCLQTKGGRVQDNLEGQCRECLERGTGCKIMSQGSDVQKSSTALAHPMYFYGKFQN